MFFQLFKSNTANNQLIEKSKTVNNSRNM